VLADLASEILAPHLDRRPRRPYESRPHGRVEGEIVIPGAREAVTGVLSAAPVDERARPPSEPCPLEPIDPAAVVEDTGRVDCQGLDGRSAVGSRVCVER
jgi:hypothetical protein